MKKIIIILLVLMTIGIVSAATIKVKTDMRFDGYDIQMWILGPYNQYYPIFLGSGFQYDEVTREITNLRQGTYNLRIDGESGVFFNPVSIERTGIYLLEDSYVTITEYFDMSPGRGVNSPRFL